MNESAFPGIATTKAGLEYHVSGMTLRDYFAAKAMQAILSRHVALAEEEKEDELIALVAYGVADAMLEERAA